MMTVEFNNKVYAVEPGVGMPSGAIDPALLSGPEQVELYNLLGNNLGIDRRVNKFADKKTGTKRVLERLRELAEEEEALDELADDKPAPKAKAQSQPRAKKSQAINFAGMRQDIRASDEQLSLKQEGSIRSEALEILRAGATKEQLVDLFKAADKRRGLKGKAYDQRIYEMIRIFCYHYGYGTKSSADGETIKLVTS